MTRLIWTSIPLLCLAAAACGDDEQGNPADAGVDSQPEPDGSVPSPGAGLAVVNSDYVTTSISLIAPDGSLVDGDCINSGTQTPNNTLALSGDVGLPSAPQVGGELVTIDHTNSALTWIDPETCAPARQLDVSTGFYANPHDVISVSATKAYVTRFETNAAPTKEPSDHDEGADVLIIDPSEPEILGRIDLAGYAVDVEGATILARPDRAILIGDTLVVTLSNLSGDFQAAGHGRLVLIDTTTDEVTGTVDIPTLKNCSGLSYVEATETLVVQCGGAFSDPDQAAGSGLAYVDLGASPPAVTDTDPVTPFGGRALATYSGIAVDGDLGFAVTFGEFGGDPKDQLWAYDVEAGTATEVDEADESYTFGGVLVDPGHQRLFLSDANAATPRVHVYDYGDGTPRLDASIDANPGVGLPPRELTWY